MKKNKTFDMSSENGKPLSQVYIDTEPPLDKSIPTGPFQTATPQRVGDLLLFVPRNEIGRVINDLTGRYGYSHLAIDCGEIDGPTGRRVMIEATVTAGVHYGFLDEYGKRPFARIPLRKTGIDNQGFCECIHSKLDEKFDSIELFTGGILNSPAKQMCSELALVCLPEDMREEIAHCHRRAIIHPLSAVWDRRLDRQSRLFMSPNGFAGFLGAPRGGELAGPDQLVEPHLQHSDINWLLPNFWKWADAFVTSTWRWMKRL